MTNLDTFFQVPLDIDDTEEFLSFPNSIGSIGKWKLDCSVFLIYVAIMNIYALIHGVINW